MIRRSVLLTTLDAELLGLLSREANLVQACRALGIGRDQGVYRLRRLSRALGTPVVRSLRGGASHGTSRLTAAGAALLRSDAGSDVVPGAPRAGATSGHILEGTYRIGSPPSVAVPHGPTLAVAFAASAGERVRLAVDPESVLIATRRFETSARNVLPGVVRSVRCHGAGTGGAQRIVVVEARGQQIPAAVTEAAIRSLALAPGRRVYLYLKATALRRVAPARRAPTRGSPRR